MNGVHDMGGLQCFGPVHPEPHEPLFHAPWERHAMALTVAMGATGQWNIDQMRSARESLPPAQYLGMSYYQIWLKALQDMMVARQLVTAHECREGQMNTPPVAGVRTLTRDAVDAALKRGSPAVRETSTQPVFVLGQRACRVMCAAMWGRSTSFRAFMCARTFLRATVTKPRAPRPMWGNGCMVCASRAPSYGALKRK
jgi:hypothetical protein